MTLPEYLSGGRIQGKTTDTSGDVTTGWEMVNTLNAPNGTTGVFDFGEENNVTHLGAYDLGSAAGNAWALRFKLVMTQTDGSGGSSDANVIIALSDNETAAGDESQDFIGMRVHNAGNNLVRPNHGSDSSPRAGQTGGNQFLTVDEDVNYYIELKRTSDTAFTWRFTTNSAFTGGSSGTVSISAGTVTGLRYIKIMNTGNCTSCSTFRGYIDDLQYWADGDTTGTATHTFDFELTDESITTITNVPAGTRYEETDTRKIFRRTGTAPQHLGWTEKGTSGTSSLIAWFDATDTSTITKDGSNLVSVWADKMGTSAYNLAQATSGDKPTWVDDDRNGRDVINFGAPAGAYMQTDFGLTLAQPYTIVTAWVFAANDSSERVGYDSNDSSNRAIFIKNSTAS